LSDVLVFPDTRSALFDLINGTVHVGSPVRAVYHLSADAHGSIEGPFPVAQIVVTGGTEGFYDRVDRVTVDVYAPGEKAVQTLESIRAFICGDAIETPSGYLDKIEPNVTPADVPYQSDTLNKATATFLVTSRPLY
jgi:hypothetical protein